MLYRLEVNLLKKKHTVKVYQADNFEQANNKAQEYLKEKELFTDDAFFGYEIRVFPVDLEILNK